LSDLYEYTVVFSTPFWRGAAHALDIRYQALTAKVYSAIMRRFKELYGTKIRVLNRHVGCDHGNVKAKRWGIDIEVNDRCQRTMNRNVQQRKAAAARLVAMTVAGATLAELRQPRTRTKDERRKPRNA
jgi:hypothetical protein